jgi:hydrogenase maturation protease
VSAGGVRVLVAGVGNVLRGDDGFGPAVLAALEADGRLPPGTRLVDVGIAGVRLVQELMDGYDVLIIIDACDRGGRPGELYVLAPETIDPNTVPPDERRLLAGDMHQLVPARVLTLAAALGVLPGRVRIVGCQPVITDECVLELTATVRRVVPAAAARVQALVAELVAELQTGTAAAAGDAIRRRDELLQVMYWLRGEGFAPEPAPADIARFMDARDAAALDEDVRGLVAAGLAEPAGAGQYRLTAAGVAEGGRRFAEAFAELQHRGHGACSDPDCDCHTLGPEACAHASTPE